MLTPSITPHPDHLSDWIKTKEIVRGGMQAIEDRAIAAYWQALEEGKSKDEAGAIFIKTYQKVNRGK